MTMREAYYSAYRLHRLARNDILLARGNPQYQTRRLMAWGALVPEALRMALESTPEELADMTMGKEPTERGDESKTSFLKRLQNYRGERSRKIREWRQSIQDRTVHYDIVEQLSGRWLQDCISHNDWKLNKAARDAVTWRSYSKYFVNPQFRSRVNLTWTTGNPARWNKLGNLPAKRRYWPGWQKDSSAFNETKEGNEHGS